MLAYYGMNDAIGCFYRIDRTQVIITLIHFELAYNSARTLFQVIQKAVHCIKTGYGILDPVYGNNIVPLACCGQKNGLGSTV